MDIWCVISYINIVPDIFLDDMGHKRGLTFKFYLSHLEIYIVSEENIKMNLNVYFFLGNCRFLESSWFLWLVHYVRPCNYRRIEGKHSQPRYSIFFHQISKLPLKWVRASWGLCVSSEISWVGSHTWEWIVPQFVHNLFLIHPYLPHNTISFGKNFNNLFGKSPIIIFLMNVMFYGQKKVRKRQADYNVSDSE